MDRGKVHLLRIEAKRRHSGVEVQNQRLAFVIAAELPKPCLFYAPGLLSRHADVINRIDHDAGNRHVFAERGNPERSLCVREDLQERGLQRREAVARVRRVEAIAKMHHIADGNLNDAAIDGVFVFGNELAAIVRPNGFNHPVRHIPEPGR